MTETRPNETHTSYSLGRDAGSGEARGFGNAPRGRPTYYNPIACELVLKLGAHGASLTEMAHELGVARSSIYRWMSHHAEFSDAVTRARELSQAYWERVGRLGVLCGRNFNSRAYQFAMRNRFPADYRT